MRYKVNIEEAKRAHSTSIEQLKVIKRHNSSSNPLQLLESSINIDVGNKSIFYGIKVWNCNATPINIDVGYLTRISPFDRLVNSNNPYFDNCIRIYLAPYKIGHDVSKKIKSPIFSKRCFIVIYQDWSERNRWVRISVRGYLCKHQVLAILLKPMYWFQYCVL